MNSILLDSWLEEVISTPEATLADEQRAHAFGITPANFVDVVKERSHLLKLVYPAISQFCQTTLSIQPQETLKFLWDLWLPLAMQLSSRRQQLNRPLIQGILGGQGTGKTTLAAILTLILQQLRHHTLSLSLDDLYKTYSDRLKLTQQDPRLIWRGPPGTHDVELGLTVLNQIRQSNFPVTVPRFDKSAYAGAGDRTEPESVAAVDIVLFEGWFVGAQPIHPTAFDTAPSPIITDLDRAFGRDMNHQLNHYLPLWEKLDSLIVLCPTDYRLSLQWRQQAEQQMIANGKSGMTNSQIEDFVKYFWISLHPELFINPLINSTSVDLVIEINPDHTCGKVYRN